MNQKNGMTSSHSLTVRVRNEPAAKRHILSGHAALALGVTSTAIFVVSAIVAFATSFDQVTGRGKLTLMLIGLVLPLFLAVLVRKRIETTLGMLGVVLCFAAPAIGLAGLFWSSIDVQSVAGCLAVLAPLAGMGLVWAKAREYRLLLVIEALLLCVAAIIIYISGEHAAVLGLVAGIIGGVLLVWRLRIAAPSPRLKLFDVAAATVVLLLAALYLLLILMPDQLGPLGAMLPQYYRSRFAVWRDTPAIIQDYAFTGSGLGVSAMVLSSYLFLLHVPYFSHIHNLFLQIAIEQGIPGLIGIIGMFVAAFWSMAIAVRRAHAYVALCAACVFASLLSLFVYGMFESDVYADGWVVSMFLSFGFAWVISQYDVSGRAGPRRFTSRLRPSDLVIGCLPLLLLLGLALLPWAQAQWRANLAAVEQSRVELSEFHWPLWPIQDQLRRARPEQVQQVMGMYRAVLAQEPTNVTALRRLGQIQLSLGDAAGAEHNLLAAYQLAPNQRATRQLLGEALGVQGKFDEAVALWKQSDNGQQQFELRVWWHYFSGDTAGGDNLGRVLGAVNAAKQAQGTAANQ